jgi:hypothetical protein
MSTKNFYKSILLSTLLLGGSTFSSYGQCDDCNVTNPSGDINFSGNQTICITEDATIKIGNINGSNNRLCVAPGVTAIFAGSDLNTNNQALTLDIAGTLHLSNATGTRIGALGIEVASTGSITTVPGHLLVFHETHITNNGVISAGNLENSHTKLVNEAAGQLIIQGTWWQHGGIVNRGTIETQCGLSTPQTGLAACEFLVGDKSPTDFQNEGTIKINGPVRIEGQVNTHCGSSISVTDGHITISKPVLGSGTIVGETGSFSNDGNVAGGTDECGKPQVYFTEGPNGGFNNNPNNWNPSNPGFEVNTSLPVVLVDFSTSIVENAVDLRWSTSVEEKSGHFVVERSHDARAWSELGTVAASGNSTGIVNYTYRDAAATKGNIWYYRLKIVDTDGSFEYSGLRSVQFGVKVARGIIYPNPTAGSFFIDEAELGRIDRVYVYNKLGKVVKAVSAVSSSSIDVSELAPDTYIVRLLYKDNTRSVHNIVLSGR